MTSKAMEHLNLSEEQTKVLEDSFQKLSKHPDGTTLMLIAAECGLSEEETRDVSLKPEKARPTHGFYPASWELRLLLFGVDRRTMCSYWDTLKEGRWVFLKKLASSSSSFFLKENGSYYHIHYMLCRQKNVLSQKEEGTGGDGTMDKCQRVADDRVENI